MPKKTAVRKDPEVRPVNTVTPHFDLINPRADREYKWVYKAATVMGPEYYQDVMGYEPVPYTAGGVRPRVGRKFQNGEIVTSQGHVLMETSKERAQELYENGADGSSGQRGADEIEKRMLQSKRGSKELLGRINMRSATGNNYFTLEQEDGSICAPVGDSDG